MTDVDVTQPRDRGEALRGIDYSCRLSMVHARLYSRIAKILRVVEIFGGSAALAGVIANRGMMTAIAGCIIALCAAISFIFDFDKAANLHWRMESRMARAKRNIRANPEWTQDQIEDEIDAADNLNTTVIEGLRVPCFNDMVLQHGYHSQVRKLTLWQRFMKAIA